mmetsp:Transcript_5008/g.7427  ORF Transcript_5008/g.7427 Transcript_5008/m.7427 type:complete len:437 (+) Transcript_5008:25-1335(+)
MDQLKTHIEGLENQYKQHKKDGQLLGSTLSANDIAYKDRLIDSLVEKNAFICDLLEDVFHDIDDVFKEHSRSTSELEQKMESMKIEYESKKDELRISLERSKLAEHKSEKTYGEQLDKLKTRLKSMEHHARDHVSSKGHLEKQVRIHENALIEAKKGYDDLFKKLINVKTYPDIPLNMPNELPNEPIGIRLEHSVNAILGVISDYSSNIILVERYNPEIIVPVRYFIKQLQLFLYHGINTNTQTKELQALLDNNNMGNISPLTPKNNKKPFLTVGSRSSIGSESPGTEEGVSGLGAPYRVIWTNIFKPLLDLEFRQYAELSLQKIIRMVDTGKIPASFRDGSKFDTFVCTALNQMQLYNWLNIILSQPAILNKYSETALIRQHRERDRLFHFISKTSQLSFSLYSMSQRLEEEKNKMDHINQLKKNSLKSPLTDDH